MIFKIKFINYNDSKIDILDADITKSYVITEIPNWCSWSWKIGDILRYNITNPIDRRWTCERTNTSLYLSKYIEARNINDNNGGLLVQELRE
jgi:hypothetical protein